MDNLTFWVLLVWALFGYWGGKLAYNKGNSVVVGIVLGLLLPPISLLLVAMWPSSKRKIWEREQAWADARHHRRDERPWYSFSRLFPSTREWFDPDDDLADEHPRRYRRVR